MTPSETETGTTEDTADRGRTRPRDVRWLGTLPSKRAVRALLGTEAASFFLAATVHAGLFVRGYEHREAMIAESVIGTVLLVGLVTTWGRPRSTFTVGAAVQAFALLGTLVGIWTILVGVGPRTVPDVAYHAVVVVVLTAGLVLAWRARGAESSPS